MEIEPGAISRYTYFVEFIPFVGCGVAHQQFTHSTAAQSSSGQTTVAKRIVLLEIIIIIIMVMAMANELAYCIFKRMNE